MPRLKQFRCGATPPYDSAHKAGGNASPSWERLQSRFFGLKKIAARSRSYVIALIVALIAIAAVLAAPPAAAAPLSIAQTPLFLTTSIDPNLVVTLDDSGSMSYAYVPDSLESYGCQSRNWRRRCSSYKPLERYASSTYNALYYDPAVTYKAPVGPNGNPRSTSFTNAYINGFAPSRGSINLATDYRPTQSYTPSSRYQTFQPYTTKQAAYYYVYDPDGKGCLPQDIDSDDCYRQVIVSATSGITPHVDERQNFANWYSFYRTRNLATVSAAALAFNHFGDDTRLAWQDLSSCTSFERSRYSHCRDWASNGYDNRIARFSGQHRQNFYDWLFHLPAKGATPLPAALKRAGELYKTSGKNSPYAYNPTVQDQPEYVCRQNYSVVMTDGLWNGAFVRTPNYDSRDTSLPDGKQYTPQTPYQDDNKDSLADIAFHYWSTDLRRDLPQAKALRYMPIDSDEKIGDVTLTPYRNPKNDPATWQHMVTFTVGLGLNKFLTNPSYKGDSFADGYNDIVTGSSEWPKISSEESDSAADPARVYDLWHAAIDSRGAFFAADRPDTLATAFQTIVNRIEGRKSSASAVALNSTRLESGTQLFQARFDSHNWSGELQALAIDPVTGAVDENHPTWKASAEIPVTGDRKVFTWNSTAARGVSFSFASLDSSEQTDLNTNAQGVNDGLGAARLNYLRGDHSEEEQNGGGFRDRNIVVNDVLVPNVLGDIVNSNPLYVGAQDFGFKVLPSAEGASYASFVAAKKTRPAVVYIGANDGMLHGFNAATGAELFAYVPSAVYPDLSLLTEPAYNHHYYVDGSPQAVDAYLNGGWKTVLAGTTGAGGRGVFVLDISHPADFTANDVLWDYDGASAGDNDLGDTLGEATIARLSNGDWVVLFGNGYNSPNQHAVLYIYDLTTKQLVKIDAGAGSTDASNGLSSPVPVDLNGDRITDVIYAGDLQGNLWKFDVRKWNPSNAKSVTKRVLFQAKDAAGRIQPITVKPDVGRNKNGNVTVYFGTGKYFETTDKTIPTNPVVQSFYGIVDTGKTVSRSDLLQQSVLDTVNAPTADGGSEDVRITSHNRFPIPNSKQGWYLDLPIGGERIVSDPRLHFGRIIFTTTIPIDDPCQAGGQSWLMELDANTGSRLDGTPFDVNNDGKFDKQDLVTATIGGKKVTVPVSGKKSTQGIIKTPGIISAGEREFKYASGSTGKLETTLETNPDDKGRLSWKQLQ